MDSKLVEQKGDPWDAMYQESPTVVYHGYAAFGCTGYSDKKWSIRKTTVDQNTGYTKREWCNGNQDQTNTFNNLSAKSYSFLK